MKVINDRKRLQTIDELGLVDTPPEKKFDAITELAARICDTPVSLISIVTDSRQFFKSHHGLAIDQTPIEQSFCAIAVEESMRSMLVQDAREDDRFKDNPLVTGSPHIVFYAGIVLKSDSGKLLGTLNVIDTKPRILTENQLETLKILAQQAELLIDLRKNRLALTANQEKLKKERETLAQELELNQGLIENLPNPFLLFSKQGKFLLWNKAFETISGYCGAEISALQFSQLFQDDKISTVQKFTRNVYKQGYATVEAPLLTRDGSTVLLLLNANSITYKSQKCIHCIGIDITASSVEHRLDQLERELMEATIRPGMDVRRLLADYLRGIHTIFPDRKAAIFAVENETLSNLAAPLMPKAYLDSLEGAAVGPGAGPCGLSVFHKERVIVENISKDPRWEKFGPLAAQIGLNSCWTQPVFNSKKDVVAVFANYFSSSRKPDSKDYAFFERTASLLSVILDHYHTGKELMESNQRFEYVTQATSEAIWDYDLEKRKVIWGANFEAIYGKIDHAEGDGEGKVIQRLHPEEREQVVAHAKACLKSKKTTWSAEHRWLKADGTYAYVSNHAKIVRSKKGRAVRVIGAMQDITEKKEEEQRLKLLESIIQNTNDGVMITTADSLDAPGPSIVFVNDAFRKITGYNKKEVVGRNPRMFQGPKTDRRQLDALRQALVDKKPYKTSIVNYKKTGETFWNEISVSPVANHEKAVTHFVAVQRNITEEKQAEECTLLMNQISLFFNDGRKLPEVLTSVLGVFADKGDFSIAEAWLLNSDGKHLNRISNFPKNEAGSLFYNESQEVTIVSVGEGLAGTVWKSKKTEIWSNVDERDDFIRKLAARKSQMKTALGIPLVQHGQFIGVLLFGTAGVRQQFRQFISLAKNVLSMLCSEIQRKRLSEELSQLFDAIPDMVGIVGHDGQLQRVNAAAHTILGYNEKEVLRMPFLEHVYTEDRESAEAHLQKLNESGSQLNFEIRHLTKQGKIKWISWTGAPAESGEQTYLIGKDVTDKKELERLLGSVSQVARIGAWELDLGKNTLYWSPMTREIHQVSDDYVPKLKSALQFYHKDFQQMIADAIEEAMSSGKPFDLEALLVTAKNTQRWVKSIGAAEFVNGKCVRLFGSIQDIHERKTAEQRLKSVTNNIPGVLYEAHLHPNGSAKMYYASAGSQEIWGLSPEECLSDISRLWDGMAKGGDLEKVMAAMGQSMQTPNGRLRVRWRYVRPDGRMRWHEGYGKPRQMEDGTIVWESLVMDITDRVELEQLVEKTSQMARIGSWELDLRRKKKGFLILSSIVREILEVSDSYDTSYQGGLGLLEGKKNEPLAKAIKYLLSGRNEYDEELLVTTSSGNQRWVRCIGLSEWANGECLRVFGSMQDIHRRKTSELKLQRSLEELSNYKRAIDQNCIIAITDASGVITSVNSRFCEISKYAEYELVGQTHAIVNSGYHPKKFFREMWKTISNGKPWRGDIKNKAKDGSFYWVDSSIVPFLDSNGKPYQYLAIRMDITERITATQLIEENQILLKNLTDQVPGAVYKFRMTPEGAMDFMYVSSGIQNLYEGLNPELLYGDVQQGFAKIVPEDLTVVQEAIITSFQNLSLFSPQFRVVTSEGKVRWHSAIANPEKQADGSVVWHGLFTDITAEMEGMENLRISNERFEKVAEATNDIIYDWDIQTDLIHWGNGVHALLGMDTDLLETSYRYWVSKVHPLDRESFDESLRAVLQYSNNSNWKHEFRIERNDGSYAFIIGSGVVISSKEGKAVRLVGALSDITSHKEYEKSLEVLNQSLEQQARELAISNAELEQFAYVASHDLQEPLRMVASFLTQLNNKYAPVLDDRGQQYIHFAVDGAKRMRKIILDLLEYSRAGKHEDKKEVVDLNEVVDNVCKLQAKILDEKKAVVKYSNLPSILSFTSPLMLIFQNLIGNALKYSKPGVAPIIKISAEERSNEYVISINDNGIGIEEEYYDKIFVIFQRLHAREEYEGSGMGLAIVKKIVDNQGGKIWVNSEVGKYSTFYFTLKKY